ncbi:MAG: hypothetical protein A3G76_05885 [Acidobacteria bacterium RIFCSPLOWO2_12_FULL_65_11]|nr:MAG: hypothetical protein A3H95_11090 [Acidobacteria bacterium RIFCSPLOWO2_02_FULL_64_15]OFW28029.1 MAG: hypothetical protein A3G76_05885 [Acidobacteria bacterium RIFCSPLOWO2_12_FULL_65_11]
MRLLTATLFVLGLAAPAFAQEVHLLVVTGVSGTEEHAKRFEGWAATLIDAAKKREGLPDANILYLAERPEADPARMRGRSTRDAVEKAMTDIAGRARPDDQVIVVLIGHGTFDGRQASFNLPGPDLSVTDWTKLLDKLSAQRVAFVNTAPASGAFLPAVAAPGRTIVTATKTGGERNETVFPRFFVEAFSDDAADADRNAHVSMLEAFNYAKNKVVKAFEQDGLLLTEHATIDDSSDGRLAGMLHLTAHPNDGGLKVDMTDPEMRALVGEREEIQKRIDALKLQKDRLDATRYEQEMEKLLTDLALKTKAIRDREAKKAGR